MTRMFSACVVCWLFLPGFVSLSAQDVPDSVIWAGVLKASSEVRIEFRLKRQDDGNWSGKLVSVDQGVAELPLDTIKIDDQSMTLAIEAIGGQFTGRFGEDGTTCEGRWEQGAANLPVTLRRQAAEPPRPSAPRWEDRPQRPRAPFPYDAEEVMFENQAARIRLAGTLTIPREDRPVPAVVLVSGSGPQDRDSTLMAHKPFLVLADFLSRHGIAVLRYDDRGVGASMGEFGAATTIDFASDARAAVDFLATREGIDPTRIGILGHSEGGLIAPLVANASDRIQFLVLLAAPGVDGATVVLSQSRAMAELAGVAGPAMERSLALNRRLLGVLKSTDPDDEVMPGLKLEFDRWLKSLPPGEQAAARYASGGIGQMATPWYRFFTTYEPVPALEKLKVPTLALFGEKDLQILPQINQAPVSRALEANGVAGNRVVEMPGLNHLFQKAETGLPTEYANIDETMNGVVLRTVVQWIHDRLF